MTRNLFLAISLGFALSANAQKTETGSYKLIPSDQWEIGLGLGVVGANADGNNSISLGVGGGLYLRKALDNIFSLRASGNYYQAKGNAGTTGPRLTDIPASSVKTFNSTILTGEFDVVISLGGNRFESGKRKFNPYAFVGGGAGKMTSNVTPQTGAEIKDVASKGNRDGVWGQGQAGLGLGFRVSDKISFGLEGKVIIPVGSYDDYLDGVVSEQKDIPYFLGARLGVNLGGGKDKKKAAPLWWANPAEGMVANIADLQKRPVYDPTDTDADGVIDAVDQEKDTPSGARVDTRGAALDSDGDGVSDYKDKEPFSPVGFPVDKNSGVANVPKPNYATEADVDRIVTERLAKFQATQPTVKGGGMADWFLPMIHFDLDRDVVKASEYGNLAAVAQVLKNNPSVSVVVTGHTDRLSSDGYNQGLSYRRAKRTIETLVERFGADRSRLVLNYGGEATSLVPSSGNSYMNRRVEFKVAQGESEQAAPATGVKKKSYKGNKNAGY